MTTIACLWALKWWIAGFYSVIALTAIIERDIHTEENES